jgi:hypothetical protein
MKTTQKFLYITVNSSLKNRSNHVLTQEIILNSTVTDQQDGAYATELDISFALPSLKTLLH